MLEIVHGQSKDLLEEPIHWVGLFKAELLIQLEKVILEIRCAGNMPVDDRLSLFQRIQFIEDNLSDVDMNIHEVSSLIHDLAFKGFILENKYNYTRLFCKVLTLDLICETYLREYANRRLFMN